MYSTSPVGRLGRPGLTPAEKRYSGLDPSFLRQIRRGNCSDGLQIVLLSATSALRVPVYCDASRSGQLLSPTPIGQMAFGPMVFPHKSPILGSNLPRSPTEKAFEPGSVPQRGHTVPPSKRSKNSFSPFFPRWGLQSRAARAGIGLYIAFRGFAPAAHGGTLQATSSPEETFLRIANASRYSHLRRSRQEVFLPAGRRSAIIDGPSQSVWPFFDFSKTSARSHRRFILPCDARTALIHRSPPL